MRSLLIALSALMLGHLVAAESGGKLVANWDLKKDRTRVEAGFVPDLVSGNDLDLRGMARVMDDPESPDKVALQFDGTQDKPAVAAKKRRTSSKTTVSFSFKPESLSMDQTIMVGPGFEFRVTANNALEFIVWHGEAASGEQVKSTKVKGSIVGGRWYQVEASLDDSTLLLRLNGNEFTSELPMDQRIVPTESSVFVGSTISGGRPFKGSVSSIRIAEKP